MSKRETNEPSDRIVALSPSAAVAEQIQRALEMMQRLRTVGAVPKENPLSEAQGNQYTVPEPLMLQVSEARLG